jgi:hypothetical protein
LPDAVLHRCWDGDRRSYDSGRPEAVVWDPARRYAAFVDAGAGRATIVSSVITDVAHGFTVGPIQFVLDAADGVCDLELQPQGGLLPSIAIVA